MKMGLCMKKFFKSLQADSIASWSFWLSTLLFFLLLLGILVLYTTLPPFLPLYNHMPWGYARLGHTYEVFIPFGIAVILSYSNVFVGIQLQSKNPLLSRFLFISCFALSLFTTIFLLRILQVIL